MFIQELLKNQTFNFNAPFRILKYIGGGETVTVYDSAASGDIPDELMEESISAINLGEDGVLEIEFAE